MTDREIICTRSILRAIKLREKLITIEMGIEKYRKRDIMLK